MRGVSLKNSVIAYYYCTIVMSFSYIAFAILQGDSPSRAYSCGEPSSIKHGSRSIFNQGQMVSYGCLAGYSLYGTKHLRCLSNGHWSNQPPICVATGCSPLQKFSSGQTRTLMKGAVNIYTCTGNSRLRGSPTIFCDGRQWNDSVPECRGRGPEFLPISNCPPPPISTYAVMSTSPESVTYTCVNNTRSTIGSRILRCLPTGQWDRNPVVCTRMGCRLPTNPPYGFAIYKHGNTVIQFRCFLNYHLIGSEYLYCNGRQWNATIPVCIQDGLQPQAPDTPTGAFVVYDGTSCSSAPLIRHGQVSYSTETDSRGANYWSITYMCNRGYRLYHHSRMFCSRRNWVGEVPQCVALCSVNNGGCDHNCLSINGRAACICRRGYRLHNNGRNCNDINECASNGGRGPCDEICYNHQASYSCGCQRGYRLNDDGHSCAYQIVDPCVRVSCRYGSCVSQNGRARCRCQRGHVVSVDGYSCQDVNECARSVSPCQHECRNTQGGYECHCPAGSAVLSSGRCEECGLNTYVSPNGRRCISCPENSRTLESRHTSVAACQCKRGYEGNPAENRPCVDKNECLTRNGGCEHTCVNIRGSHICHCNPGYTLDLINQRSCSEIDECASNNGGCQHQCRNSPGSFSCICNDGYAVNPEDKYTCIDVDECAFDSSRCPQVCVNYDGGYRCDCNEGFRLNRDGRTCAVEICAPLMPPPHGSVKRACTRLTEEGTGLPVGTTCNYQCDKGFRLEGTAERVCNSDGQWSEQAPTCQPIQCPHLEAPMFGYVTPASCTQTPGEFRSLCMFACESGYNLLGSFMLKCTNDGSWSKRTPICTRDAQIRCPEDITAVLPDGTSQMTINLPEADHTLDFVNSSVPLTDHIFQVGQTRVTYMAFVNNSDTRVSCSIAVDVIDEEAPQPVRCPSPYTLKIQERYTTSANISRPEFTDNVGVTSVTRTVQPGGRMTWGTYTVHYVASDAAGNDATCTFTITIKQRAQDCGVLDGPLNGNNFCSPWLFGQICQPTCLPGFYYFSGPLPRPTYICGADARWNPAKKVSDCTAYELVGNSTAPCPAGKQLKDYPALDGPACMDCPRGMYSTDIGDAQPVCKDCPVGLYQGMTGRTSCNLCPDGTTTGTSGAISVQECQNSTVASIVHVDTVEGDVVEPTSIPEVDHLT